MGRANSTCSHGGGRWQGGRGGQACPKDLREARLAAAHRPVSCSGEGLAVSETVILLTLSLHPC